MTGTNSADLARLVASKSTLLLDFDGPICSIFAGYPAPQIAEELRGIVRDHGLPVSPQLAATDDPLAVLRQLDHTPLTRVIATALQQAETNASDSAAPTPGGHEVIRAATASGRHVAIVSNNSEEAVHAYLKRHALLAHVGTVAARYNEMPPSLMKPNPHLVLRALDGIGASPVDGVLVGDSVSDIEAARATLLACVGFADDRTKLESLRAAGADALITDMRELAKSFGVGHSPG
jgi:beta-phosphoglucomutase-like phosphatase (HAD superfamily)